MKEICILGKRYFLYSEEEEAKRAKKIESLEISVDEAVYDVKNLHNLLWFIDTGVCFALEELQIPEERSKVGEQKAISAETWLRGIQKTLRDAFEITNSY